MSIIIRFVALVLLLSTIVAVSAPCLAQMTPGLTQSAAKTANIGGRVVKTANAPVAGAVVLLFGAAVLRTTTNANGAFLFRSVPFGTYLIVVDAVGLGRAQRPSVIVNGDVDVAVQYQAPTIQNGLKTIAEVSTRSAGAKINVTPASIVSVSPTNYAFSGNTSWQGLLDTIPGVSTGGGLDGGYASTANIVGSPLAPVLLSINGALPYETAVMIDGMPFNNIGATTSAGQGTDLSNVPMTSFEAADVVRGPGANAPSIVDSIGGTFVLHGPGAVAKNAFELSFSNDPYGGIVANEKAALRLTSRLSLTLIYGSYDSPGPLGSDSTGTIALTPTITTVNGKPFLGCTAKGGSCTSGPTVTTKDFQACYPCGITDTLLVGGVPLDTAWVQHSYGAAISYSIAPTVTAEVFYTGSAARQPFPSYLEPITFAPGANYSGTLRPGMYDNYQPNQFSSLIDTSSHFLEEKVTANFPNSVLRVAALQDVFYDTYSPGSPDAPPNGEYRLWGTGYLGTKSQSTPVSYNGNLEPVTFESVPYDVSLQGYSRDLLISYAVQTSSHSSGGLSYVTSYYNNPYSYNNGIYGSGSQPSSVAETTDEVRAFGSFQVSDRLTVDGSWYFASGYYHVQNPADPSSYTDAAYPYNAPRLGATWSASNDIVFRAAAGGGFALPPLFDLVGSNAIYPQGNIYYQYKTNLALRPEQSFGFDVGTDMRFNRDTVLSFDLYRTNLFGQFYYSTTRTGSYQDRPLYTNQYNNLAQSRYQGVNLTVHHDVARGVYWNGSLGLTRAYVVSVPPGFYDDPITGRNSVNTEIVPGINFPGVNLQAPVPYTVAAAQVGYRWKPGTFVDIAPSYFGKGNAYFEPAFAEVDLHAGYALTNNVSLSATLSNLTNIYARNYALFAPTLGAPSVAGPPYALFGLPYGARSLILTANFHS